MGHGEAPRAGLDSFSFIAFLYFETEILLLLIFWKLYFGNSSKGCVGVIKMLCNSRLFKSTVKRRNFFEGHNLKVNLNNNITMIYFSK